MKHAQLDFSHDFSVIFGNERAQAAVMVLQPDESTGGPNNRHKGSDQWLYVVDGKGTAVIEGQAYELRPGELVVIEQGETHEIRNEGDTVLQTLNFYAAPAFAPDGGVLPAGKA